MRRRRLRSAAVRLSVAPLALVLAGVGRACAPVPQGGGTPEVLTVPVHGEIGVTTAALVRRAFREARNLGVAWVVLDVDTPGGMVPAMREVESVLGALRESGVATAAYVRHQALSAGAYVSLACTQTYMAPGASIGAITPIVVGPGGPQQIQDDDVRRKAYSAFRADVRSLAEARKLSEQAQTIAEAMVDPTMRVFEVVYEDAGGADVVRVVDAVGLAELEARDVRIRSQRELGRTPLTLTADEALRWGFSSGTFGTLEEAVREGLGRSPASILRLEPSWSETAVTWLEGMKPFLFLFGFILLLVEVKTPGFALPGVLGVLLLALGLFSSFLVGLAEWTEIILFFLGLVAIGVEIFVLPGTVIFGVVGFLCVVAALVLSQQAFVLPSNAHESDILLTNLEHLLFLVMMVVIGTFIVWRYLPRVPVLNRVLLEPPTTPRTGDANVFDAERGAIGRELLGKSAIAVTDLRPAGVVDLGTERLDVVTQGYFVERGTRVRVVEVSGNRIVVEVDPESGEAAIGLLVLLVAIGLGLVVAEVFFVSFGILSVGAAVALVSAVFLAFTQHGQATGFVFLTLATVGVPITVVYALRYLPRTRIGKALILSAPDHAAVSGAAEEPGLEALLGKHGETVSDLRPSGFARVDERRVDVVSRGELIERGTRIRVIAVEGNRVVVAEDRSPDGAAR
jgi:membrane-bound serine protease (ClpP class)